MNNLTKRIIFGILGGALLFFLISFSEYTFMVFVIALNVLGLTEFYKIAGLKRNFPMLSMVFLSLIMLILMYYREGATSVLSVNYMWLPLPLFFFIFLIQLFRKDENPTQKLGLLFLGFVYVTIPFLFCIGIAFFKDGFRYEMILGMLFLIWANDSGAYFAGKAFGRTKLFERISPKKTLEGSIGGFILSLGVAYLISRYWTVLEMSQWMSIAAITTVFGGLGDLVESMMKRDLNIKDSGNIIPGHGGILDRFDALLLSAPFVYLYLLVSSLL